MWDTASKTRGARRLGCCLLAAAFLRPVPIRAAGSTGELLERLGREAQAFWERVSGVTCTESLVQTKLGLKGKVLAERKSEYDYLVLMQLAGGQFSLEESRIERAVKTRGGEASFLVTNGFAVLMLIFHPHYQGSYEFREAPGARRSIEFTHLPGHRSPSALVLKGREYPLEWRGAAEIDPESGNIARIRAELKSPMEEIGLLRLEAVIDYARVAFSGLDSGYWLPRTAVIDAATKRQTWRNVHRFDNYRRFSVETEIRTASR